MAEFVLEDVSFEEGGEIKFEGITLEGEGSINLDSYSLEDDEENTDPRELIAIAEGYYKESDFKSSSETLLTAYQNAKGGADEKIIAKLVKEKLVSVYLSWYQKSIEDKEYPDAEEALKNYEKVSANKSCVVEERLKLYSQWAIELNAYDKNTVGFIIVYIKLLRCRIENGLAYNDQLRIFYSMLYNTENRNYWNVADQLLLSSFGNRLKIFLEIVLLVVIAILGPIFSPFSISAYVFSFAYMEMTGTVIKDKKLLNIRIVYVSALTLISLAGVGALIGGLDIMTGKGVFFFIVVISLGTLFAAVKRTRFLLSYKHKNVTKLLDELFPPLKIKCASCGKKHKIAGNTVEAVQCPNCGAVIWEGIDLNLKNRPEKKSGSFSLGADWEYALSRFAIFSMRMLMRHFFGI